LIQDKTCMGTGATLFDRCRELPTDFGGIDAPQARSHSLTTVNPRFQDGGNLGSTQKIHTAGCRATSSTTRA